MYGNCRHRAGFDIVHRTLASEVRLEETKSVEPQDQKGIRKFLLKTGPNALYKNLKKQLFLTSKISIFLQTGVSFPVRNHSSIAPVANFHGFHPAGVVYFGMVMKPELAFWNFVSVPLGMPKPVVTAFTGTLEVAVLLQSAQLSVELVLVLVVTAATGTLEVVEELGVQSAHVIELDAEVDTSIAATGAVGLDGLFSLGVAVTVIVLCTTSVTVTYDTEQAPPSLPGPAGPDPAPPAPVCTGSSVIVSVVVDCR